MEEIKKPMIIIATIGYIGFMRILISDFGFDILILCAIFTMLFLVQIFILQSISGQCPQERRSRYIFPFILSYGVFFVIGATITGIELKFYGFIPFIAIFFYSLRFFNNEKIS